MFLNRLFILWIILGESCSVAKELDSTSAMNAVYQDKTNILFSVGVYHADCATLHLGSYNVEYIDLSS